MKYALVPVLFAVCAAAAAPPVLADEDPAAYYDRECVGCHVRKKKPLDDKHLTRQEWKDSILKMIELDKLDPVPSKAYIETLSDWLVKNHGSSGVAEGPANKAPQ